MTPLVKRINTISLYNHINYAGIISSAKCVKNSVILGLRDFLQGYVQTNVCMWSDQLMEVWLYQRKKIDAIYLWPNEQPSAIQTHTLQTCMNVAVARTVL